MSVNGKTLSTKIEEVFLGILRFFILMTLAISLVGAGIFAYQGMKGSTARPLEYTSPQQPVTADVFIEDLKHDAQEKSAKEEPSANERSDSSSKQVKPLEAQLDRQIATISDFLSTYDSSLNNAFAFKQVRREEAYELANSKSEADLVAYAKGQADFFDKVFKDKNTIATVRQRVTQNSEYLGEFFKKTLAYYPDNIRAQRKAKEDFEAEERQRVIQEQAQATMWFYVAGGMFAAFLLVSLVLVLIKIERNLRVRTQGV